MKNFFVIIYQLFIFSDAFHLKMCQFFFHYSLWICIIWIFPMFPSKSWMFLSQSRIRICTDKCLHLTALLLTLNHQSRCISHSDTMENFNISNVRRNFLGRICRPSALLSLQKMTIKFVELEPLTLLRRPVKWMQHGYKMAPSTLRRRIAL